jgi:TonB family protein
VKDFYKATDTLQMEAVCSSVNPRLVQDGHATFYHKNGNIERTGLYVQGLPSGVLKTYYINGNPHSVRVFKEKEELIAQYWTVAGQSLLVNGTGLITEQHEYATGAIYIEVKDSVQLRSYYIEQNDTIYHHTQTPAEYRGGMETFYRGIAKTMKYPATARRNGVEGRVYVKFIVNEQGALTNASVIKGIGSGCDTEALVACLEQKDWQPARYNNKPVKMQMVLPVTFRLQ